MYLNTLNDEKANRLQLDESRIPCFYESQEDEYEYEMRVGFDMKISKSTMNQEAVHFVDPAQITMNTKEKQPEQSKVVAKKSLEGTKPIKNETQNPKLSVATEASDKQTKFKQDKPAKP